MIDLKVEDFMKFRNLIYDKAGIFFETKKIYFVKKRLEKRMNALNISDIVEYYNNLKFQDKFGKELQNLLNVLTTNETYFFREENQLNVFADHCLPEIIDKKKKNKDNNIRVWSAGCSSGEEPYSLAILIMEKLNDISDWNIEIIATDIDTDILASAEEANYSERSVRNVSPDRLKKFFLVNQDGFRVRKLVKNMVNFQHMNLFDSIKVRQIKNIDFIFCRNVLIYFDEASRKIVVANFYDALNNKGYIYLGHSESVSRINTAFDVKRIAGLIMYQKPL